MIHIRVRIWRAGLSPSRARVHVHLVFRSSSGRSVANVGTIRTLTQAGQKNRLFAIRFRRKNGLWAYRDKAEDIDMHIPSCFECWWCLHSHLNIRNSFLRKIEYVSHCKLWSRQVTKVKMNAVQSFSASIFSCILSQFFVVHLWVQVQRLFVFTTFPPVIFLFSIYFYSINLQT